MNPRLQNSSAQSSSGSVDPESHSFDFDLWASAVRSQMLEALEKSWTAGRSSRKPESHS
ncbi:hypothetical protein GS597_10275 [Synechococcales cyanobacterium C]|uniref:Uncharacterized protein n=1 Tax=Petrachloros mirabilis ULC683 TaxID=2781853 RepID=A0A8K1ZZC0_9CYAN|nr:hypothetical protein [Petrachloros mirabilis]NCJ06886.1 hypothetical protein [Petrachloros mirabilis ULC683]